MNSLTFFFLMAAVVPMLVTAKSVVDSAWEEWHDLHSNHKEILYSDKWECKNVDNCQTLYGTEHKWICNSLGMCEEEEDDDDDSFEHAVCNQALCERSCDEGYRCTCSRKRHCVQIDDFIYSPAKENSHNEYNSYSTDGGSESSAI